MDVPDGFLKESSEELFFRYQDRINSDYCLALSEVLLSSCCWKIKHYNSWGTVKPNIFIETILPSGDHKSAPIKNFIMPILKKVEEECNKNSKVIKKLIISDYTEESIIKFFNPHQETVFNPKTGKNEKQLHVGNVGIIIVDELSRLLKATSNKKYMSGITEINSLIYDGKIPERYTIKHGLQEVPECYKAYIAASTPAIYALIKDDAIIQGGMNRVDLLTISDHKRQLTKLDVENFFVEKNPHQMDERFEYFAQKLLNVVRSDLGPINLDDDAQDLWVKYELEQKKKSRELDELDLCRGYLQRQAEKALKRSILYTISRNIDQIDHLPERYLLVIKKDVEIAISNQEDYFKHWKAMLRARIRFASKNQESYLRTDQADRHLLKSILQLCSIVSRQKVIEETNWNDGNPKLKNTIDSFVREHKIEIIHGKESKEIVEEHKNDCEWLKFQKVKYPMRGQAPTFYKWIGEI